MVSRRLAGAVEDRLVHNNNNNNNNIHTYVVFYIVFFLFSRCYNIVYGDPGETSFARPAARDDGCCFADARLTYIRLSGP